MVAAIGMVRWQLGVILGSKAGFLSRRVRHVEVAGCFLTILLKSGGKGKVAANVLGVSRSGGEVGGCASLSADENASRSTDSRRRSLPKNLCSSRTTRSESRMSFRRTARNMQVKTWLPDLHRADTIW